MRSCNRLGAATTFSGGAGAPRCSAPTWIFTGRLSQLEDARPKATGFAAAVQFLTKVFKDLAHIHKFSINQTRRFRRCLSRLSQRISHHHNPCSAKPASLRRQGHARFARAACLAAFGPSAVRARWRLSGSSGGLLSPRASAHDKNPYWIRCGRARSARGSESRRTRE